MSGERGRVGRLIREWFGSVGALIDVALFLAFFVVLFVATLISTNRWFWWLVVIPGSLAAIFVLRHQVRALFRIEDESARSFSLRARLGREGCCRGGTTIRR